MKKLRLGVVGTSGMFGGAHWPALKQMNDVEMVAFCDIVVEKARFFADQVGATCYDNFEAMLEQADMDAVSICTSNVFHSKYAIAALEAGKHVICEKPDAVSSVEAEKMRAAAERNGLTLMVIRNNRYRYQAQWLKEAAKDGYFGELYTGRCGWIRRRGIPGAGGWYTTKELSGGGPLIDLGVHMIDLAIWIMGNPKPVAVSGATYCKFASDLSCNLFGEMQKDGIFDVEDLASGYIRFDNGATLQIEFSWASNIEQERNFVELRGTKAGFTLDRELNVFNQQYGALCNVQPQFPAGKPGYGHEANLKHFVDVVLRGTEPDFTPTQGLHMIQILEAVYKSAQVGREILL
ncbi:Gfo/Idh/MocA family protein [Paenibacillus roseipurpureus]|uniref:Gfo/Idh/MocA family oxidoreductase n=1 Tax=Paenibacillus roseopurpureus TaxID=2918901 RepID=A0AA96RJN0_9BACL|nr:Gfo/Idh/MocA family oxidoreductase [Paenibacillus sp. MBLB1832]WNR43474.1 Gfo/Idh/MocA family oxidoreductase [Paenibacillus sp. MBLB1832]